MTTVTKVLVGSRLHGLANEGSDYDWRGVHMHGLKPLLSPFRNLKNTTWIEGDEDNTSYELRDFCKDATHGSATILEVFFSDEIRETGHVADEMRENWEKFMDTEKFIMASRGYAQSQYNKMNLFEPDARTPKFAVAYLRVMWQCAVFLETEEFHCRIDDTAMRQKMLEVKHKWRPELIPDLTEELMRLQSRVTRAHATARITKPDIPWIEDFIYRAYTDGTTA